MFIYLFIIIIGGIIVLFIYITRLASNEIFSPSNKIHQEVGRAKDLSAPLYYELQVRSVSYRCVGFLNKAGNRGHILLRIFKSNTAIGAYVCSTFTSSFVAQVWPQECFFVFIVFVGGDEGMRFQVRPLGSLS
jgi:hypothetical protein